MKQLTDAKRLEIAVELLTTQQLERYRLNCTDLEQNCERNGFHNVSAECENIECNECLMDDTFKHRVDCPYVD